MAANDGNFVVSAAASVATGWTITMDAGVTTIKNADATATDNLIRYYERNGRNQSFTIYDSAAKNTTDVVIYIERDNQGTDVENATIKAADDIQKVIIDGNLYIIRGGHVYDATGAVVR